MVGFVNVYCLYAKVRLGGVNKKGKISWVLSYVQRGVAETWKDNILEEIKEGISVVETMEKLFKKMREEFREFNEESRKVDMLWVLVQGTKTCDKYVQELRRAARGSGYKERISSPRATEIPIHELYLIFLSFLPYIFLLA